MGNCEGTTKQKQDQNSGDKRDKQLHVWHLKLMMVSHGHQWTQEVPLFQFCWVWCVWSLLGDSSQGLQSFLVSIPCFQHIQHPRVSIVTWAVHSQCYPQHTQELHAGTLTLLTCFLISMTFFICNLKLVASGVAVVVVSDDGGFTVPSLLCLECLQNQYNVENDTKFICQFKMQEWLPEGTWDNIP